MCIFSISEINKLFDYINSFYTFQNENLINWFINKPKKYKFFITIKYKNEIIKYNFGNLQFKKDFKKLIKYIENEIIYTNNKDLTLNITILENKENKKIIKKFIKEFCILSNLINKNYKDNIFHTINNFIFKNLHIVIFTTTTLFMFSIVEKMNDIGILMNFISVDTLSLMVEIIIQKITLFLGFIAFLYIIIILIIGIVFYKLFQDECDIKQNVIDFCKVLINVFLIILPLTILFDNINIKKYNKDYEKLKIQAIKSYISIMREPSIRTIQDNNETMNILILGKNSGLIYYLKADTIKSILEENNNTICSDNNSSYLDKIVKLLLLKNQNQHSIANKRYLVKPINKINFIDTYPSFNKSFCIKQ